MPDITKCTNARCVAKSDCYRFTSVENYGNQYYDIFVPDVNLKDGFRCDMYLQRGENLNFCPVPKGYRK